MVKSSKSSSRFIENTIRVLSGDQAGVNVRPLRFVTACRPDPSGCMSQRFCTGVPGVRRTYAIHSPFGDHAGSDSWALMSEIRRGLDPSEPMT